MEQVEDNKDKSHDMISEDREGDPNTSERI